MYKITFFEVLLMIAIFSVAVPVFADPTQSDGFAVVCNKCDARNPKGSKFCTQCGALIGELPESKKADALLARGDTEAAIALIEPYCEENQEDVTAKIIYAKALLNRCEKLKEERDEEYEAAVFKPFRIGQNFIKRYQSEKKYLSEGYYICARAYWINNRPRKAVKCLDAAIATAPDLQIKYYIFRTNVCEEMARKYYKAKRYRNSRAAMDGKSKNSYKKAKKSFEELVNIVTDDQDKAEFYYNYAIFLMEIEKNREARKALNTALDLTENEELKQKIVEARAGGR